MAGQVWDANPNNVLLSAALLSDYEALPDCIKATVTKDDYNGMGHEQRATLVEDLTTPDEPEDNE